MDDFTVTERTRERASDTDELERGIVGIFPVSSARSADVRTLSLRFREC